MPASFFSFITRPLTLIYLGFFFFFKWHSAHRLPAWDHTKMQEDIIGWTPHSARWDCLGSHDAKLEGSGSSMMCVCVHACVCAHAHWHSVAPMLHEKGHLAANHSSLAPLALSASWLLQPQSFSHRRLWSPIIKSAVVGSRAWRRRSTPPPSAAPSQPEIL